MKLAPGLTLLMVARPAAACIPPAPPVRLSGESESAYAERSRVFYRAYLDEEQRAWQTGLYDRASRVSLARVTASAQLPGVLNDGLSRGRRVEVQPLAVFKGRAPDGRTIALQDAGVTSCGHHGGGSATAAAPGDYVLLFEGVSPDGPTGHLGLVLTEVREPRVLERFSEVVQQARAAARQ